MTCALEVNGTFVVQLRQKFPHWSSYWSDWSSNISVPEGEEGEGSLVRSQQLPKMLMAQSGLFLLQKAWGARC